MKKYGVSIPITGHYYVEVEANNRKAAIVKAKYRCLDADIGGGDLQNWDMQNEITTDSSLNRPLTSIDVKHLE